MHGESERFVSIGAQSSPWIHAHRGLQNERVAARLGANCGFARTARRSAAALAASVGKRKFACVGACTCTHDAALGLCIASPRPAAAEIRHHRPTPRAARGRGWPIAALPPCILCSRELVLLAAERKWKRASSARQTRRVERS